MSLKLLLNVLQTLCSFKFLVEGIHHKTFLFSSCSASWSILINSLPRCSCGSLNCLSDCLPPPHSQGFPNIFFQAVMCLLEISHLCFQCRDEFMLTSHFLFSLQSLLVFQFQKLESPDQTMLFVGDLELQTRPRSSPPAVLLELTPSRRHGEVRCYMTGPRRRGVQV